LDDQMLPVLHNVDSGVRRLIAAPRDLPHRDELAGKHTLRSEASPQHRLLFDQYCSELAEAVKAAETWWARLLLRAEARRAQDPDPLRSLYARQPAGPASHPSVVGVVRKYWLACDAANRGQPYMVAPEVFLMAWLVEQHMEREVVVLSGMPYWPMGMDTKGNWV
jgi:hypothetical protein